MLLKDCLTVRQVSKELGLSEYRIRQLIREKQIKAVKIRYMKGAVVLDPFNGSGTTGLVARLLGRRYIGIDKEEAFLKLTLKRIKHIKGNGELE